jgi:hypothetical protein
LCSVCEIRFGFASISIIIGEHCDLHCKKLKKGQGWSFEAMFSQLARGELILNLCNSSNHQEPISRQNSQHRHNFTWFQGQKSLFTIKDKFSRAKIRLVDWD